MELKIPSLSLLRMALYSLSSNYILTFYSTTLESMHVVQMLVTSDTTVLRSLDGMLTQMVMSTGLQQIRGVLIGEWVDISTLVLQVICGFKAMELLSKLTKLFNLKVINKYYIIL